MVHWGRFNLRFGGRTGKFHLGKTRWSIREQMWNDRVVMVMSRSKAVNDAGRRLRYEKH
jgi:hypothetical protein